MFFDAGGFSVLSAQHAHFLFSDNGGFSVLGANHGHWCLLMMVVLVF